MMLGWRVEWHGWAGFGRVGGLALVEEVLRNPGVLQYNM